MELPDDAKHELDELERMIQVEVQTCDYIRARKAAMDENVITSVRKEADEMTKVRFLGKYNVFEQRIYHLIDRNWML
jgi:hypothetical protein